MSKTTADIIAECGNAAERKGDQWYDAAATERTVWRGNNSMWGSVK